MAIIAMAIKNTDRNEEEESARKPNAAPGFLTYVILKNPSITGEESWRDMIELTYIFVI